MIGYGASGTTHDFFAYNSAGQVWNGAAFVTWADGDYASYRITATEVGTSGRFSGTAPTGTVTYELRERGASLATSYVVWTDDTLDEDINSKTALIGTGVLIVSSPVSGDGDLLELIKDTDYLAVNGRALEWTFDEIPGITTAATGRFGIQNSSNGTEVYVNTTGAVTEPTAGTFKVSFDITNTTLTDLTPEEYDWSVEVLEGSYKITIARNRQNKTRVNIVEKYT